MKIYSHIDNNTHKPLPYFSYGQIIPRRLEELLKAPKALGLDVSNAKDLGLNPIFGGA